jgi:hypothetical protein
MQLLVAKQKARVKDSWAGKEVALGIAVTGICLYNPDECRSPGHSSGSGCAGPAIWSDQAPG